MNFPYNDGITTKVSNVEEIIPPITTEASGFWTSDPIPLESIIGKKPNTATRAVIKTGLGVL